MTVPEIWREQNRGGKKNEREQNHIASPTGIANYAHVTAPLTDLVKKECPNKVEWMEPQQKAFNELKQALGNAPILRVPDFQRPFIVRSDASNEGLGAMLLQEFEDGLFPIAYAVGNSRKTKGTIVPLKKSVLQWYLL